MCQTPLHEFLRLLPKCEQHIHLEGALTPTLLFQLAAQNNISLPGDDEAYSSPESLLARYKKFTSLDDFLHYHYIGMSVLINATDFETLAWNYFQHAAADGVHHAEVFFDPQAHTTRGVSYSTVLSGFEAACRRAEQELSITTLVTACFHRHLPAKECVALFESGEMQSSFKSGAVKGIGLDSSELDFPPELFAELFQRAKKQGLRLTTHACEEGPPQYAATALDVLGVERIDHGTRLAEDAGLMKRIAAEGTLLTVCPISNVVLRCVDKMQDVPIRQFLDAGVKFSINSDDPAYFGGYILDNYCAVQAAFDLSVAEWERISRDAIEGSWCGEARKKEMLGVLEQVVTKWEK